MAEAREVVTYERNRMSKIPSSLWENHAKRALKGRTVEQASEVFLAEVNATLELQLHDVPEPKRASAWNASLRSAVKTFDTLAKARKRN